MIRLLALLAGLAVAACGQEVPSQGDAPSTANAIGQAAADCAPPALAMADSAQLQSGPMDETRANFVTAFNSACAKGLLSEKPLIDPKATDQTQILLINAPDANVASIYLSDVDGSRMVLEYPFLTTDGKSQVPSASELEEAIYCNVVGATLEEQEASGRCLVD